MDRSPARRHLERLAGGPRPAGSRAEAAARDYCAALLVEHGFEVRREPFEYSTAPGRLATPAGGIGSVIVLAGAGDLGAHGAPLLALVVLLAGGGLLATALRWSLGAGVLGAPWWRARSENLTASRGEQPRCWLMAHLDSKSQPVPIAVRALGVMATLGVWAAAVALALAQAAWGVGAACWPWLVLAGLLAGAPVAASVVQGRSPGALDDASGVATVLRAVELLSRGISIGVVLTSGEELALAGARAWVQSHPGPGWAINIDGVDDTGSLRFTHGAASPAPLIRALATAAREGGIPATAGRLLPGVLLDGVALAEGGWRVVTVSRGDWRTVLRIHTPHDDLSALSGRGVEGAAAVVAAAIGAMG